MLEESAEEKAGLHSAGAGRQHNGRLGKIEMSQVGAFLSLVTPRVNTWIDGELYLPERWFSAAYAEQRKALCIPEQLTFQKKPELGWQMIQRVQKRAIPFQAVVMDDLYGRNEEMRQRIDDAGIKYYGDVPVQVTYSLSNAPEETPLETMAWRKTHRYLIERSNEDAKGEIG